MADIVGYQGSNVRLPARFFNQSAVLTDPDAPATYIIYDPDDVQIVAGTATKLAVGLWEVVYFLPINAKTGMWKIVWSATINSVPLLNTQEYFEVKLASESPITNVTVDDAWMRQVKKVLAFPGIPKVLLTDDQIREFCIFPAMFEYFRKFPIEEKYAVTIEGELNVPYPDNQTMGAVYASITRKFGSTSTASSFWDIIRYQALYGSSTSLSTTGRGQYGTSYNWNGAQQSAMLQRTVADTFQNQYATYKAIPNDQLRQIEAYASSSAQLVIHWAKFSNNFSSIPHTHIFDVVELSQHYLLTNLADAASMITDAQLDKNFNVDAIRTRAQELYDKVITNKWNLYNTVLLLRN